WSSPFLRSSVSSHSEPHRGAKTGPEPPKKSGGRRNMAKIHAKMSAKAKKRRKRRCNRQKRLKPTRLSYVHSCASRRAQTFCKWLSGSSFNLETAVGTP